MPRARSPWRRRLPDGSLLHNRRLAALPRAEYDRILQYVRMTPVTTGRTLHGHRARINDVCFPNGGVYSVTNEMQNGPLVEVATVGREGMRGIGVFFGDRTRAIRYLSERPAEPVPLETPLDLEPLRHQAGSAAPTSPPGQVTAAEEPAALGREHERIASAEGTA